jgi:Protein kinase domain
MGQPLGSQYVLHDLLGRGAMGQVFRGSVRESGQLVAVKILKPELVSDADVVARFFRERMILTSVSHPNVAKVLDLVIEGDTIGIVMELVDGQDLRRYLRPRGTLAPAEAVGLACQLLRGLAAVHAAGIIHRDVKPENVLMGLVSGQTGVKLTDFGVSRLSYGSSLTKMSSLIGTPEYMAPELADHDRATSAADLYSAGIVLYEMLAGRTPFAGGHPIAVLRRQLEQPPPPIPGVAADLWAQIAALLDKDPRSRPESAAAALACLEQLQPWLAGLPPLPPVAAVAAGSEWERPPAVSGAPGGPEATRAVPVDQGTILRHRDRGGAPDELAGTARDRSNQGSAALTGRRSRPRRPRVRPWLATVILAVAVAVLGTVLVLQDARSLWAKPAAGRSLPAVSYSFPVQRYASGLVVARRWTLGGEHGSQLTEVVTASSATGRTLMAWFQDSIPAAIASAVQTLRFTSGPVKVVRPDPVVEWYLKVPAHGSVTVGYVATVAPGGTTAARLAGWANGLDALEQRLNTPAGRPKPAASPAYTPTTPAPAYTPTTPPPPQPSAAPDPYPTYSCDPSVVTCNPNTPGF